jgi:hypothetical protein
MPSSLLDQDIFDQWWEQALVTALSRTKTFILDAKMGFDQETNAADDLVYDTDDSDATPVFRKSPHIHLQYHKFLKFADDLSDFPDPLLVASEFPSKNKIIQCPCRACPPTAKNPFKSYRDLRRHARRSSLSNVHNEHDVLDFYIGAILSCVSSSY